MFNKLSYLVLILATVACTASNPRIIVTPEQPNNIAPIYQGNYVTLNVADIRTSQHLVQIDKENSAASLINTQTPLKSTIEAFFTRGYSKQQLLIADTAPISISVNITQATINVKQNLTSYTTQTKIMIDVVMTKPNQKMTKSFSSKGKSEGVLSADIAVLERDFNQQLSTLLAQILYNADIQKFIK